MKFLSLERLVGPGRSQDENFEIMNLELIKADLPQHESFRLSAPDGGIDIYSKSPTGDWSPAFQCKAYPRFRPDLVSAVSKSASSAKRSAQSYPWSEYILIIPFVPTSAQRTKLFDALRDCGGEFSIYDGDELEAKLFRHPAVARRFFPELLIATSSEHSRIVLGLSGDPSMIELKLLIHTWGQTVPVEVSPDAKCGSLLNLLVGQLGLPVKGSIACVTVVWYKVRWHLILETATQDVLLDPDKTLRDEGVPSGATIALKYNISFAGGMKAYGGVREEYVSLSSYSGQRQYAMPKRVWKRENALRHWIDHELKGQEATAFPGVMKTKLSRVRETRRTVQHAVVWILRRGQGGKRDRNA